MKKIAILFLVGLALLLSVASAFGQTGGGYDLSWNALSSGGLTFSSGGSFTLGSTSAQPAVNTAMAGGSFSLTGGFWAPYSPLTVYIPVVRK